MEAARLYATVAIAGINASAAALRGFGGQVDQTQKGMSRMAGGAGQLAGGLVRIGAAATSLAVGGLAAAARTGIDFEDAFAGVRKTVDGTKPELDAMYDSLRQLATRIPVKFTDLAAIATEAGALGVPAGEVVHFTEVIARLSSATQGLTVEAATEAVGKLGNILHIHGSDVDRFASSLVALGNAGASTEADIIETAKRFGAAGSAAKLTAAQVLGFASAIASLGVEPEAAGSSLSRLFNKITLDIGTGDKKLAQFAKTAGLSTAAFTKLFKGDSTAGLMAFLKGLGQLDRFQVAKILKDAGITNIRDVNAVQLLSQNYQLLADQVGVSGEAFQKNTELMDVSAKRFDTLKSKLKTLWNTFLDGGEAVSEGLNPAIGRASDKLAAFVLAHRADLINLGKDAGRALDDIDWRKVQSGAETFVKVMQAILDVVKEIPPEIAAGGAALLALNKASGGLLISGGANVVQGLGEAGVGALQNLVGSRGGALGRAVAGIGAQRVFVVNWPAGGLGGLGGAGVPGIGGGGGGGLLGTGLRLAGGVGLSIVGIEALGAVINATSTPEQQAQTQLNVTNAGRRRYGLAELPPPLPTGPSGRTGESSDARGLAAALSTFVDRQASRGAKASGGKDDIVNLAQLQRASDLFLADKLSQEFRAAVAGLKTATKPVDVQKAVAAAVDQVITKGKGNVDSTRSVLADLKTQLAHTHDPQTAAILRAAIGQVEKKLTGREWIQRQLDAADKLVRETSASKDTIHDLAGIQRQLLARGDVHAARIIGEKIDAEKREIAAASRAAGQAAAFAIRDKDLSVTVKTYPTFKSYITIRDIAGQVKQVNSLLRVAS